MAIRPFIAYPGKTAGVSPEYPDGKARNIVTPHDGLGTPWDEDLVNDMFGFFQGMLAAAGITASGTPETALDSQFLDALRALFLDVAGDTMEGALDLDDNQLLNVPDAPANGKAGVNADYVDNGDATTLSSAQGYADSGDATTLSSAQGYADSGDTTVAANAATAREAMADGTATGAERILLPQAPYTAETNTSLVLRPDGANGVVWSADSGTGALWYQYSVSSLNLDNNVPYDFIPPSNWTSNGMIQLFVRGDRAGTSYYGLASIQTNSIGAITPACCQFWQSNQTGRATICPSVTAVNDSEAVSWEMTGISPFSDARLQVKAISGGLRVWLYSSSGSTFDLEDITAKWQPINP